MANIDTSKTAKCKCPLCGHRLDHATGEGSPEEGNISICIQCLGLSVFASDLSLKPMDMETFAALRRDPETWQKIEAYRYHIREVKKSN